MISPILFFFFFFLMPRPPRIPPLFPSPPLSRPPRPPLVPDPANHLFLRVPARHPRQLEQPLALFAQQARELFVLERYRLLPLGEARLQFVEVLLLDRQRVELAVERVLTLVQPALVFLEFPAA